ncbi:MAG: hypothetical protein KDD64_00895 [Bdellovibrionales bacterium]|nr:hypothetical protein [Bdellovibrionales bacterium]
MLTAFTHQAGPSLARHEYLIRKYYSDHQRHFDPEIAREELKESVGEVFMRLVKRTALVFCVYVGLMFALQGVAQAEETGDESGNTTVSCVGCIVACDGDESCDYSI